MQPYLFPYLGYFQLIHSVDKFIIYDHFKYIYQGWVNRNRLLQINQTPFYFIAPVPKKNLSQKRIKDIKMVNEIWKSKLLKSIHINYSNTRFYNQIFPFLKEVISSRTDTLSQYNKESIRMISEYLSIDTKIVFDFELTWFERQKSLDRTNIYTKYPKLKLENLSKKIIRAILICKHFKGDGFINLIGGQSLYPKEDFKKNNLDIHFLKMNDFQYPQRAKSFYSHLSIIDVLMNCGKDRTQELLDEYTLV